MPAVGLERDVGVVVTGRDHTRREEARARCLPFGVPGQDGSGRRGSEQNGNGDPDESQSADRFWGDGRIGPC